MKSFHKEDWRRSIKPLHLSGSFSLLFILLSLTSQLFAQERVQGVSPILSNRAIQRPIVAERGMVVAGEERAARAALKILKAGGNAIDAAVGLGFALSVTLPRAGNIGGGGFMLLYSAKEKKVIAIDYRETAPARAERDMFLNKKGDVDLELARWSHRSAGVPGSVAGLLLALEKYGSLSRQQVMAPAIELAEKGFRLSREQALDLKLAEVRLNKSDAAARIFLKKGGGFYRPGELFVQRDLARTLKRIARHGVDGFYTGETAELIVSEMERGGGVITREDLKGYRPVIREPLCGAYRQLEVCSMGPPSSGGLHLLQILNTLEGYNLAALGHNSAATIHLMTEAMKQAYADRSKYPGDPGFTGVPVERLTSKEYAKEIRKKIDLKRARPSAQIAPVRLSPYESNETTHFSVVDGEGNSVSNTYTLNFSFGSGIVVSSAGFLLNNEMDDFSAKPGVPNAYGLVGGRANEIAPGKRMLSSMSPTIVLKNGRPWLVTGSPGGPRIITTTLQVLLNVIDHGMNIAEAIHAPRIHHQWLPDELRIERGISPDTIKLLIERGHRITYDDVMGAAETILIGGSGLFYGASDPRRSGLAIGY